MADRIPILILATSGDIAAVFSHSIEGRHYALEVISPHAARYPDLAKQYQVAIIDERAVPKGTYLGNKLREHNGQIEFLSVVDAGDDRRGVDALNHGAFDYQPWPPNEREFFERVSKCVKKARLLPPTDVRFGNYRLYRRLATGGMAELFLAEPLDRARVRGSACVVVKRLLPHLAHREEFTTMLMDEARISSQLKHPNIVSVLDFGQEREHLFLAMEYVPGCNLGYLGRRVGWRFPAALAAYVVSEICQALDYAHAKQDDSGRPMCIIHRDVNPPNVLIGFDGRVMLADFGIAKATERATETVFGAIKGKIDSMSPEQLLNQVIDCRADIFATGTILYELLSGTHPFHRNDNEKTKAAILAGDAVPPSAHKMRVDKELDDICMRALSLRAEDRFATAGKMRAALQGWLETQDPMGAPELQAFVDHVFFGDADHQEDLDEVADSLEDSPDAINNRTLTGMPALIPGAGRSLASTQKHTGAPPPWLTAEATKVAWRPQAIHVSVIAIVIAFLSITFLFIARRPVRPIAPGPSTAPTLNTILTHTDAPRTPPPTPTLTPTQTSSIRPRRSPAPTPAAAPMGKISLVITGQQLWGSVAIDGQPVGETPLANFQVKSGNRSIAVTTPRGNWKGTLRVAPSQHLRVRCTSKNAQLYCDEIK